MLADADHKAQQEGRLPKDHTEFLSAEIFGRRPEQLSVAEFVNLTNAVARKLPKRNNPGKDRKNGLKAVFICNFKRFIVSLHRNLSQCLFKMDDYHAENMN